MSVVDETLSSHHYHGHPSSLAALYGPTKTLNGCTYLASKNIVMVVTLITAKRFPFSTVRVYIVLNRLIVPAAENFGRE